MCEKEIDLEFYPDSTMDRIATGAFNRGVECRTMGNYGSQVHDMDGWIHFVICDICLVKHSSKMLKIRGATCKYTGGAQRGVNEECKNARDDFTEQFTAYRNRNDELGKAGDDANAYLVSLLEDLGE
jgi:hypothetical protein